MATREFTYRPNGSPQFLQDHLTKASTAVTTEEQVGPSIKIPGGMLGKNGSFEAILRMSATNNANVKTMRVRAGNTPDVLTGTVLAAFVNTSLAGSVGRVVFGNRDDQAVNVVTAEGATLTGVPAVTAIDTSKDVYLVFSSQTATAGAASHNLDSYKVELFAEPSGKQFQ